ncbi:MAG: peptide chain release factor N(5)-glutamine methyltransferase [Bacteroidota bacterium]
MIAAETPKKIWTLLDLVTWGTTYLTEKGFDDPRLNIELLLAHLLRLQRIQLYTNFDRPLSESELGMFKELLKRRLSHEPLQYILGETEFMGLKFAVDPRVLIPRPDTEILVETVINKIKKSFLSADDLRILDIGTGSGCIAVSLAKLLPNATVTAIDMSSEAIELASVNAGRNGVLEKISFLQKNFLTDHAGDQKFHCIVSNPPYISNREYGQLPTEVKEFEPTIALADGGDGLTFFKEIAEYAAQSLLSGGFVAVEHAFDQSESAQQIFQHAGLTNVSAIKDFGGHFRCVVADK